MSPETAGVKLDVKTRLRLMAGLVVLLVLVGALMAFQTKAIQVLLVISGSMEPTLAVGDRILIDANGYAKRNSVVVVQDPNKPEQPEEQMVKRVVGVGGDVVEIRGGILYVNGKEQFSRHVASNSIHWRDVHVRVPDHHLFLLGDNRNNSYDSLNFGPLHVSNVTGVLKFIIWPPKNWGHHRPPPGVPPDANG